jgi:hypothetical protein
MEKKAALGVGLRKTSELYVPLMGITTNRLTRHPPPNAGFESQPRRTTLQGGDINMWGGRNRSLAAIVVRGFIYIKVPGKRPINHVA